VRDVHRKDAMCVK